jgi:phage terminase large subunit-like protein
MIDLCHFIDELAIREDGQPLHLEDHQRKILTEAFRTDDDDRFVYRTIIYSAPKKSGKTAINALVCLWWGHCVQPPDEIIIAANDLDQSVSRVFEAAKGFISRDPDLRQTVDVQRLLIRFDNDTTIKAIPSDYTGEAGANQGLASFDELWGFMSEKSTRLFEELCPVPTRKNSIRFISTYAGWEGESILLEDLYGRIFDKQGNIKPGVKRPLGENFPVYTIGDLFMYWDHEARMPWQTETYYESQREDLRVNTYLRLHENKWVSNESSFFDMQDWDGCVDPDHYPPLPNKGIRLYVGADASVKKDRSAVVSVYRQGNLILLGPFRIWQPSPKEPMDFETTMESYIRELYKNFQLVSVAYDPFQFHRSATTLRDAGIPMTEFPQTVSNLTEIGQNLYDAVKHRTLKLYEDDELRKEASFAIGKETPRGMRIVKEKSSHRIDAIVSLSMATFSALTQDSAQPGLFFCGGKEATSSLRKEHPERVQNLTRMQKWFLDED